MPAFTLYGARGSTNTERVRLTLSEGGFTDYDFVLVNLMKGEQKVSNIKVKSSQAQARKRTKIFSCQSQATEQTSSFVVVFFLSPCVRMLPKDLFPHPLSQLPQTRPPSHILPCKKLEARRQKICKANTHRSFPTQSPENLTRNPWGKIPVIVFPDGFTLYESRAICKYLARKYNFPLLPLPPSPPPISGDSSATEGEAQIRATALFEQAESIELQSFADPAGKISFEKFAKKLIGLPTNEAVVADALRAVESFFDVAERRLLQQRSQSQQTSEGAGAGAGAEKNEDGCYMAGDNFSLVDIFYIPLIQRLIACGYEDVIVRRKAVNAWVERCVSRPAIQKILAADKEAMAAAAAAGAGK